MLGVPVADQQTPRAVTTAPPSSVTLPANVTDVVLIICTARKLEIVGSTAGVGAGAGVPFFEQLKNSSERRIKNNFVFMQMV
jgi:hypothetical protein